MLGSRLGRVPRRCCHHALQAVGRGLPVLVGQQRARQPEARATRPGRRGLLLDDDDVGHHGQAVLSTPPVQISAPQARRRAPLQIGNRRWPESPRECDRGVPAPPPRRRRVAGPRLPRTEPRPRRHRVDPTGEPAPARAEQGGPAAPASWRQSTPAPRTGSRGAAALLSNVLAHYNHYGDVVVTVAVAGAVDERPARRRRVGRFTHHLGDLVGVDRR